MIETVTQLVNYVALVSIREHCTLQQEGWC